MLSATIYSLCLISSAVCATLLIRSYGRNRTKLLLFSAICFVLLAINNLLVVIDVLVLPAIDFSLMRQLSALAGVLVLLYGFVFELE